MRLGVVIALACGMALAVGGSARADDVLLSPGGAFHYGHLVVAQEDGLDFGYRSNYKGPIKGTLGFAINRNWSFELRFGANGTFDVVNSWPEPGGGTKPALPATIGSPFNASSFLSVGNGTIVRDPLTGIRFNDAQTTSGDPLLGGFVFTSNFGAENESILDAIADDEIDFSEFFLGRGTSEVDHEDQPVVERVVDAALSLTKRALAEELRAARMVGRNKPNAAAAALARAQADLKNAWENTKEALANGEIIEHEGDGFGELTTAEASDRIASQMLYAIKKPAYRKNVLGQIKVGISLKRAVIKGLTREVARAATLTR